MTKNTQRIIVRALNGEKNIPSPYHPEGFIYHQYVMIDDETRFGYLLFWCNKTFNGINIDRIKVPENVDFVLGCEIEAAIEKGIVPFKINFVKTNKKIWF